MAFLLDLHVDTVARLHHALAPVLAALDSGPVDAATVDSLVLATKPDATPLHYEVLIRRDLLDIASTEGPATAHGANPDAYYARICRRLDLALALSEKDVCDDSLPWAVLEDLLKSQTVTTCSHIFAWIEHNAPRLTRNMVPNKSKALLLLRTLNDLLRRVSKTGTTTTFCGRILLFLSSVFELGERSGVNLRGEYGPEWESVQKPLDASLEPQPADEKRDG